MRLTPSASAGVAALGLLFAATSFAATNAGPRRVAMPAAPRSFAPFERVVHVRRPYAPTTCSTNYSGGEFVGISSASDIAGGLDTEASGGQYNEACDTQSGVGTGYNNIVGGVDDGAKYGFIGGGSENIITDEAGFVGGGESNTAGARDATVSGGTDNNASGAAAVIAGGYYGSASGTDAFVGGGNTNTASGTASGIGAGFLGMASGNGSFIGGGGSLCNCTSTINLVSGNDSFIGAGDLNTVSTNESFIGSGSNNTVQGNALYGTILGGNHNLVSGEYASVLGGFGNTASGSYAIVAGGDADGAHGTASFAAGYHADATDAGSFVWSDYVSGSTDVKDTAKNEFVVRASGGTTFYSNEGMTSGVSLTPGSGTFASLSDRNAKTNVVPLDDASVLSKVAHLPVATWEYKTEKGVHHVGPMAQDFYAAFGTGVDDRHITSIDEDGVALAAIKALYRDDVRKTAELATLRNEVNRIEARLAHART